jgi:hypothetical protein
MAGHVKNNQIEEWVWLKWGKGASYMDCNSAHGN